MSQISQVFAVRLEDGSVKTFNSKDEATSYLRRPKIKAALDAISDNPQIVEWLLENKEVVENAFDTGTIRRVTKSEANKLAKALEALKEIAEPKIAFLQEHAAVIQESFRWPSVKRMTAEEKASAAKLALVAESENEDLADWIIEHKDQVLEAYQAGVEKRPISKKALEGLAAYQAAQKAKKEAAQQTS